jgi:hypothetical protein
VVGHVVRGCWFDLIAYSVAFGVEIWDEMGWDTGHITI